MEVKALKTYKDIILGRTVAEGETISVSKERGEHLIKIGYASKEKEHTKGENENVGDNAETIGGIFGASL